MRKQSLIIRCFSLALFMLMSLIASGETPGSAWIDSPKRVASVEVSKNLPASIEIYQRSASVSGAEGRNATVAVTCLYEPKSGLLWWLGSSLAIAPADATQFLNSHSIYLEDSRIVVFWASGLGNLLVKESRERVKSLEQAWAEIAAKVVPVMADLPDVSAAVQNTNVIPEQQFLNGMEAVPGISPQDSRPRNFTLSVRSATRAADKWIVVVVTQFGTGALLTLDNHFKVLEVEKIAGKFVGQTVVK